jgi:hypothetical protein
VRTGAVLVVMLAAFPGLFYVSRNVGRSERTREFCHPASIVDFQFKETASKEPTTELQQLNQAGKLALLLETKDRIVVFKAPQCRSAATNTDVAPSSHVFTVLRSDLRYSQVEMP